VNFTCESHHHGCSLSSFEVRCSLKFSNTFLCDIYAMCTKLTHMGLTTSDCLSVCPSGMTNSRSARRIWMKFGKRLYAIGVCPKIILFNFLQSVIQTWRTSEHVRWDRYQHHLQWGHTIINGNRFSKSTQLWCSESVV
jgi:hypothetical protein